MSIKAVLFDLDGTLLPMDQDTFVKCYFGKLVTRMSDYGFEPQRLMKTIFSGVSAMIKNNGEKTNEERFWEVLSAEYGDIIEENKINFEKFYINDFDSVSEVCKFTPKSLEIVNFVKARGFRTALATSPLFPSIATEKRMGWAGLKPSDFEFYTTFENYKHAKPNIEYYYDVLRAMDLKAEECLMVGNDVTEDMIAASIGMRVFLLTDYLINRNNIDISQFDRGGFDELFEFIEKI